MKDVEALVGDDRPTGSQVKAQRDPRTESFDRMAIGVPSGKARAVEVDVGRAGRREDARLMAELSKADGKAADVIGSRHQARQVVGRNKADFHAETPRSVQAGSLRRHQALPSNRLQDVAREGGRGGILIPPRF